MAKPLSPSRDLDDREQVIELVRRFYADVAQDDLLGPMYNDVAKVNWAEHLPKLLANNVARVHAGQLVGAVPDRSARVHPRAARSTGVL